MASAPGLPATSWDTEAHVGPKETLWLAEPSVNGLERRLDEHGSLTAGSTAIAYRIGTTRSPDGESGTVWIASHDVSEPGSCSEAPTP